MDLGRLGGHRPPFGRLRFVHLIGPVLAGPGAVGGHDRDLQLVGLLELHFFSLGGAGHAGEARVEQEEVLVGDRSKRLGFGLNRQALLGLDRLVLAIAPAAPRHHPAGELVDDHRIAAAHDVVHILDEQLLGLEGVVDVVGPGIGRIEQVVHPQHLFGLGVALVGERAAALLFIHLVVALGIDAVLAQLGGTHQLGRHLGRPLILLLGPLHLAGDDQRRAGFVDQDRVDFINHAVVEVALHHFGDVGRHVVAEVVEPQLRVGGVGDVAAVVDPPAGRVHVLLDQAHAQAQEAMDLAHPLGVAAGQVIVHRHHVHTAARQGVEVGRQRGHQGLALAGLHLGDLAVVQHHAADQLHVEVAHAQHPPAGLAHHGKGLGQQLIEQAALPLQAGLPGQTAAAAVLLQARQLLAELGREAAQFVVGEGGDLLLQQVHVGDDRLVALQLAGIGITQQELEHGEIGYQSSGGSLLRPVLRAGRMQSSP